MKESLLIAIAISCSALVILLWFVRRDRMSLGLSAAYVFLLLLNHVPGAIVHLFDDTYLTEPIFTVIGMWYTAFGVVAFVIGVFMAMRSVPHPASFQLVDRKRFYHFCVLGGFLFLFGLGSLRGIPTIGTFIDNGASIWMLGPLLGLRNAFLQKNMGQVLY